MSNKRWKTAEEVMAELQADQVFQSREAERERKWADRVAAIQAIERPILQELRSVGVAASSTEEMTKKYAPLSPQIVQLLLSWLPRIQNELVKECLIRSLGAAREPFDGTQLIDIFLLDTSESLRWPIANTIAEARPYGVAEWLSEIVKNRYLGDVRGLLLLALARLAPAEKSLPILLSIFDELPGNVAIAISEVGGKSELVALRSRVGSVQGWEKAELLKAIRKIENRA